jgi:hypothetical protein
LDLLLYARYTPGLTQGGKLLWSYFVYLKRRTQHLMRAREKIFLELTFFKQTQIMRQTVAQKSQRILNEHFCMALGRMDIKSLVIHFYCWCHVNNGEILFEILELPRTKLSFVYGHF